MPKKDENLFIIIDSNSLVHRAYHALPRLTTKQGELVNAVYGFVLVLMKVLKEFKPRYIAAAFDVAGPTFRDEEYEDYKAGREKAPDELYEQIPVVKDVLKAFNIPVYEKQGFEADDVVGTVATKVVKEDKKARVLIVSGDLDTLQLVNKRVNVYTLRKGVKDTVTYDIAAVRKRFGLTPEQMADYKGLRGDPSDNIPGVPQIGEKTAATLLKKHPTLEDVYETLEKGKLDVVSERIQNLLNEHKEQAFFSRMLATIKTDVNIDFNLKKAQWGGFEPGKVEELFRALNFTTLVRRLGELEGFETPAENEEKASSRKQALLEEIEAAREAGVLEEKVYKLEKDLVPAIIAMEEKGIAIDKRALAGLRKKLESELASLENKIYKAAGMEFNINSPQQLSEVLFEKLGIETKGLKKTPGKKVSTAAGELEKIKEEHPVVEMILDYRELQKLLSTYVSPLPQLAQSDGRIHTTFKPLGTATGRLSSTNPNLQNIPIRGEWAQDIRKAFKAEKGNLFLACDYSQMELRIVAHLAEDKNLIETFRRDEDVHVSTAALVFGVEPEKVTKQMRYRAKALNFGIIYGIGPKAFARSAGIEFSEAKEFINKYFEIFRGVADYMEKTKEGAHTNGYVETMFGRKRFLPDLKSPNPMLRAMAERAAINMPVQGTAADIVKMAMVKAHKEIPELPLVLQIHDELLWEAKNDIIKKAAPKAQKLLENIVSLSVPLKVDSKIGNSWGTLK